MFIIEDNMVKVHPETLLVGVFKTIWDADKTTKKEIAIRQFAYIEFMLSPKKSNPFFGYTEDIREGKILAAIGLEKGNVDSNVKDAYLFYQQHLQESSPSLRFYNSALEAARKLQDFFQTFDLDSRNDKGYLLYKPGDITKALQDTDKIIITLFNLKDKIEQELIESKRTIKNRDINPFETGDI